LDIKYIQYLIYTVVEKNQFYNKCRRVVLYNSGSRKLLREIATTRPDICYDLADSQSLIWPDFATKHSQPTPHLGGQQLKLY